MKKLKLLCAILCIILVILIFRGNISSKIINEGTSQNKEKNISNITDTINKTAKNNGGNVIEYDDYIYYVVTERGSGDSFKNRICRKNKNDQKEEVIYDAQQYKIGERIIIYEDNIFFNMTGKTYYINLKTRKFLNEFVEGILYSIADGKIIYGTKKAIYVAEYYEKTYALKQISLIAKRASTLIGEDTENIYFMANGINTIFAINKQKQTLKNIDASSKNFEFLKLLPSNKYLYVLFIDKNENLLEIHKISKSDNSIEKIRHVDNNITFSFVKDDELYFSNKEFTKIYKVEEKDNIIKETSMPKNAQNYYEVMIENKNIMLYKNNEKLVDIKKGVDAESILADKIEMLDGYVYLNINILQNEKIKSTELWRVKEDGTNLEELT